MKLDSFIHFDVILETLPIMLQGMIGIFLVTGAIIGAMLILSKYSK